MIDKMALLCSSIPLFNALSDLLTDLEHSFDNHFIKHTAIDPFLGILCAGTGDLVSGFIQWTLTIWQTSSHATSTQTTDKRPRCTRISIS